VFQNSFVTKPQDLDVVHLNFARTYGIVLLLRRAIVRRSVQFNNQPARRAVEINHITSDAMLTPELHFLHLAILQMEPQNSFCGGGVFTKLSSPPQKRLIIMNLPLFHSNHITQNVCGLLPSSLLRRGYGEAEGRCVPPRCHVPVRMQTLRYFHSANKYSVPYGLILIFPIGPLSLCPNASLRYIIRFVSSFHTIPTV